MTEPVAALIVEKPDWQAFTITLDADILRRFDDIVRRLPSTASPAHILARVDACIKESGFADQHPGRAEWNDHVRDMLELARLRDRLQSWFFERSGSGNHRLAALVGSLVLDPRSRIGIVPATVPAVPLSRMEKAKADVLTFAPLIFLPAILLALMVVAAIMTFESVIGWRNAVAGITVALVVASLSTGAIIGAIRNRPGKPGSIAGKAPPVREEKPDGHGILVTRDSVCMADDVDAPHASRIAIDPASDALAVAEAILHAGYLPAVAGGSTWSVRLGDAADADAAVFGHHRGGSFSYRVDGGIATLRSAGITRLDLRYHQQDRPDGVIGAIAMTRRRSDGHSTVSGNDDDMDRPT